MLILVQCWNVGGSWQRWRIWCTNRFWLDERCYYWFFGETWWYLEIIRLNLFLTNFFCVFIFVTSNTFCIIIVCNKMSRLIEIQRKELRKSLFCFKMCYANSFNLKILSDVRFLTFSLSLRSRILMQFTFNLPSLSVLLFCFFFFLEHERGSSVQTNNITSNCNIKLNAMISMSDTQIKFQCTAFYFPTPHTFLTIHLELAIFTVA